MDESTLAKAMEPFFTTKGIGKGTGLGLSMVHGMAEQSGGSLVLKSRKGEGTTAELWLPVATSPIEHRRDLPRERQTASVDERRLKILAVDDDALVLMNTGAMLEELGHQVFEAISGAKALSILRRENIDLVITDQAMPHMTGLELAEEIKTEWPHLTVIIATGYAELPPGTKADLPRLAKPFTQQSLANAIAAVRGN